MKRTRIVCTLLCAALLCAALAACRDETFGDWEMVKTPSCLTDGEERRVSSPGGKTETRTVAALGHEYRDGICIRCGVEYFTEALHFESIGKEYAVKFLGETKDGEICIPAVYNGLPVTMIGNDAFYTHGDLTAVHIPDGVETIGEYAFYKCRSIEELSLPANLQSIGKGAFFGCTKLKSAVLPAGVEIVGKEAFGECFCLSEATVPDGVTRICEGTFLTCISLRKISLGKSVKVIETNAFEGCDALSEVYYAGSPAEWEKITIEEGNEYLLRATIVFGEP